ncbi:hypothetical protein L484_010773 [Morus notabilis]|uniref:FAS1 domain-containing protein n=1 Tax=Morus notabilis TaxID=981085 RepID=W9SAQ7_9ROSA|nr:putative fasciclin-like arabinogalactan protein 20 [Morus notabilis]EXC33364.1 hypothetical protein L484_010773 [Morus notabilis]
MASSFFIFSLIILSLSSSAICFSLSTLLNAAYILSNSNYLSMSLTLQLAANSKTLALHFSKATVFAPSGQAFLRSGQPSLLLLRYHVSPSRIPAETLKTLHRGTRIPTLIPDHSLVVTASPNYDGYLSLNNVRINDNDVLDDGSVVICGVDDFLSSPFEFSPNPEDVLLLDREISKVQRLFYEVHDFAPVDQAFKEDEANNIGDYAAIFRRHVVPRWVQWKDSTRCEVETKLLTCSPGFTINVTVADGVPMLNGLPVAFREVYRGEWLVVHGLNGLIKGLIHPFSDGDDVAEETD